MQLNDPDGWVWFLLYLSIGIIAFYHETFSPILIKSMAFLVGIGLLLYIPNVIEWVQAGFPAITDEMSSDSPLTELIREAGGLLLGLIVLIFYTKRMYKL